MDEDGSRQASWPARQENLRLGQWATAEKYLNVNSSNDELDRHSNNQAALAKMDVSAKA